MYLRYEGQVKNKKLNKKDVVNIVKEIWKEKVSADLQVLFILFFPITKNHLIPCCQLLGQSCWLEGIGKPGLHLSHSSCHSLTLSTEDAVGASHFAVFQPPFPTVTSGMYLPAATLVSDGAPVTRSPGWLGKQYLGVVPAILVQGPNRHKPHTQGTVQPTN